MRYDANGALLETGIPGLKPVHRGKVRDIYDMGDSLLFVATDRISAFDCVMPNGIPDKGRVLTAMSLFWFDLFSWAPNHVLCSDASEFPAILKPVEKDLAGRSILVKKAKTSRRTFFRSFRKMTGCTPQEYRTQLRLKLSVELLRGSSLNIGEIALRCGFYDTNHFCRIFREHFKTTPRRFRLNIQERENRPAASAKRSGCC